MQPMSHRSHIVAHLLYMCYMLRLRYGECLRQMFATNTLIDANYIANIRT